MSMLEDKPDNGGVLPEIHYRWASENDNLLPCDRSRESFPELSYDEYKINKQELRQNITYVFLMDKTSSTCFPFTHSVAASQQITCKPPWNSLTTTHQIGVPEISKNGTNKRIQEFREPIHIQGLLHKNIKILQLTSYLLGQPQR